MTIVRPIVPPNVRPIVPPIDGEGVDYGALLLTQSDLLEWWRADAYSAGTWTPRNAAGHSLTQATGALQAAAATRLGLPAALFDGAKYSAGSLGATIAQPVTWYFVMEPTSLVGTAIILDGNDASDRQFFGTDATPNWMRDAGATRLAGTPTAAPHLVVVTFNGASGALYVDNMVTAVDSGNTGANAIDAVTLGTNFLGSNGFIGYLWDALLFSTAHTQAQRTNVANYVRARYGISVTV